MKTKKLKSLKKPLLKAKGRIKITQEVILKDFKLMIPALVSQTVKRYENGYLASIFNESDMIALAEDTALEVCRRVIVGIESPGSEGSVDFKGANSYFKTSFVNQTKKVYEKYAKTDIRASIQTVGSDEAMSVATNRNKYNPEDSYIVHNQIVFIFDQLKKEDSLFNKQFPNEKDSNKLQHFFPILKDLFDGFTAQETCDRLSIDMSTFLRQKRLASELIKSRFPNELNDLRSYFSVQEDLRIHTKDVEKRKKYEQLVKDFHFKSYIYISTKIQKSKLVATLYCRIDILDSYEKRIKQISPKLVSLATLSCLFKDSQKVIEMKKELFKMQNDSEILQKIEEAATNYMSQIKEEERKKKIS